MKIEWLATKGCQLLPNLVVYVGTPNLKSKYEIKGCLNSNQLIPVYVTGLGNRSYPHIN